MNVPRKLTIGSCFSGIGGLELGLEWTGGFETKWQIENDPYASAVLSSHWPGVVRYGDIASVDATGLEPVDLICGGDPCQENSAANQSGSYKKPSRGAEFIALIDACRPWLVLRENPSNIRPDAPWPWWRFRSELERLGYTVLPFRIRACCVGFDHQRDRLFLLAEMADSARKRGKWGMARSRKETSSGAYPEIARSSGWGDPPRICRKSDGVPSRVDRLRCLGNAVVPQVAEKIGQMILDFEART